MSLLHMLSILEIVSTRYRHARVAQHRNKFDFVFFIYSLPLVSNIKQFYVDNTHLF